MIKKVQKNNKKGEKVEDKKVGGVQEEVIMVNEFKRP